MAVKDLENSSLNEMIEAQKSNNYILPVFKLFKELFCKLYITAQKVEVNFVHELAANAGEYHYFGLSVFLKIMATYYPYQLQQRPTYPITITEWSPMASTVQTQSPAYTSSVVPFVLTPTQILTQICPYTGTLVAESVLPSIIANPVITEIVPVVSNKPILCYTSEDTIPSTIDTVIEQSYPAIEGLIDPVTHDKYDDSQIDPIEFYLTLPKELFPTARMFTLDPNPIIDEFCKLVNVDENTSWILDLEFGIPRIPITRAIPVYDVQFNSIHCKNTPGAIHPGFESCSYDFKRVFLFYYDCIISTWYKGYIIMNYDKSVKNFQSWLLLPMQIFGMCWP